MLVSLIVVQKPDSDLAANMEIACQEEAKGYERVVNFFLVTHIVSFLACLYREVFSIKTHMFA
jgi:hypothetical protein